MMSLRLWYFGLPRLLLAAKLATIAYLPEYRHAYDIEAAAERGMVTDVVLFSVELSSGGALQGEERLPSRERVTRLRAAGTKVHLCIGGAGRSAGFSGLSDAKTRRKAVAGVLRLLRAWSLDGVDVDWETPRGEAEWRTLGNFLNDIRRAWSKTKEPHVAGLLLSFTLWPRDLQGMLAAKAGQKTILDVADRIHMMTYGGDERTAIKMWKQAKLPIDRLTFGIRFFLEAGTPYYEIPDDQINDTKAKNERQRVRDAGTLASVEGLAGCFVWEVGQDRSLTKRHSLLEALLAGTSEARRQVEL